MRSKNSSFNSSGDDDFSCLPVRFLSTSRRNFWGNPFNSKALVTCFCSFCFPSFGLGMSLLCVGGFVQY